MKTLFRHLGLAALAAAMVVACTVEEPLVEKSVVEEPAAKANSVKVTVGAGIMDGAQTKSTVDYNSTSKERVLKFTEGDMLYVWKSVNDDIVKYVAGFLTMVGSPSADGKSASFTGTLRAYDLNENPIGFYEFGSDPLEGTTATLVHAGLNEDTDYIIDSQNDGKILFYHLVGSDVENLMTSGLYVTGNYDSGNNRFALGCSDPIFNCYISGLIPLTVYSFSLLYPTDVNSIHPVLGEGFTTDENGVGQFAFASPESGEHNWIIRIYKSGSEISDIDFGTINLTTKIYNVRRWWNGSAFCAPTNLASINTDYTTSNGEILTGKLASNYKLIIPAGATVTLAGMTHHAGRNVNGIYCEGSARINLVEGTTNDLTQGHEIARNGIYVYTGTLTIGGKGKLLASGGSYSDCAGIGGYDSDAHIVINGGNITATGGYNAAGIGAGLDATIGDITINGGNVTVTGGSNAAGIGCGHKAGSISTCGNITFNGGTVVVNAGSSGWGIGMNSAETNNYNCGDIRFVGGNVTVNGYIATKSPNNIYINGEPQNLRWIKASSSSPFVYPVPATQ